MSNTNPPTDSDSHEHDTDAATDSTSPPKSGHPAPAAIIDHLDDRPDPTQNEDALQEGHVMGRRSLAPILQACSVPHDDLIAPDERFHPAADAIVDSLTELQHVTGHRMYRVFDDFIELIFQSLRATPDHERYQETMKPYSFTSDGDRRDGQPATNFAEAFAKLLDATASGRLDVLGDVYHILGANSSEFGQYFTPHNVTDMMVRMIGRPELPADVGRGDTSPDALEARITRGDTAGCGSGRLIAYQAQHTPDAVFHGTDVDVTCAKMTTVNCALLNVDAYIQHGDALTQEIHQAFSVHHDPDLGGCITVDTDPTPPE